MKKVRHVASAKYQQQKKDKAPSMKKVQHVSQCQVLVAKEGQTSGAVGDVHYRLPRIRELLAMCTAGLPHVGNRGCSEAAGSTGAHSRAQEPQRCARSATRQRSRGQAATRGRRASRQASHAGSASGKRHAANKQRRQMAHEEKRKWIGFSRIHSPHDPFISIQTNFSLKTPKYSVFTYPLSSNYAQALKRLFFQDIIVPGSKRKILVRQHEMRNC